MDLTANDIIKYIGAVMDQPCTYGFGELDVAEFMNEYNSEWCEAHCRKLTPRLDENCEACWRKFFETLVEKGVGL